MKIEVLYFDGCPNHKPAVERVQQSLREEGVSAELVEVNVGDGSIAQQVGFLGSPSVRVNGLDVEPEAGAAREYGMMCRTYSVDGRREGLPSREMLRQAIREANSGINNPDSGQSPSNKSKSPTSLFAAWLSLRSYHRQLLLHPADRLRLNGFFDPGRVRHVRRLEALSAWPHVWTSGIGILLLLPAKEGAVRTGLSLRHAGYQPIWAFDALACDCGRCPFCGVSLLLWCSRRMAAFS